MKKSSKIVIEILDDGTVKINATQMLGDEKQILSELSNLASDVGGELKVEKHVHKHHHHHHHDDRGHHHH